eukprot:10415384-Heterocapsa_arctica.AAC.1
MQRVANSVHGWHRRQLFRVDNLSLALAFERGRCSELVVLSFVRKFWATSMANNLRPHTMWIPSELNSSDEPSREHDSES